MTLRYYAESDGDDTWVGHYTSHQAKTFYVIDRKTGERAADNMKSMDAAKSYAIAWNEIEERRTKDAK